MNDFESKRERGNRAHSLGTGPQALNPVRRAADLAVELERATRLLREGKYALSCEKLIQNIIRSYIPSDPEQAERLSFGTMKILRAWSSPTEIGYAIPDPRELAVGSATDDERRRLRETWGSKPIKEGSKYLPSDDPFNRLIIAARALLFIEKHTEMYRFDRKQVTRRPRYDPPANLRPSPQDEEAE